MFRSRYLPALLFISALPLAAIVVTIAFWSLGWALTTHRLSPIRERFLPQIALHLSSTKAPLSFNHENKEVLKRVPRYLQTLFFIFIIPNSILLPFAWKKLKKAAFLTAVGLIALIGWAWSWTVSFNGWWGFGEKFLLGIDVFPYLPFEEILFYPLGGALCIILYVCTQSVELFQNKTNPLTYWTLLILGTSVSGALAWATQGNSPYYLNSQLFTYNFLCCLALAPFVAKEVNLAALSASILIMGTIGYVCDFLAVRHGWWGFYAVTGLHLYKVPLEEFNFFCFAPASAISIYVACRKLFQFCFESPWTARVVEMSLRQARRAGLPLPLETLRSY